MPGNPQVLGLLEEMLDSGKTPEEVCRDCPELLPEVRQRWQEFQFIDAQVRTCLPGLATLPDAGVTAPPANGLPQVPGYEVEAVLGRGGMGVVYKARHLALKRTVALKMLAAGHPHPAERARFRAEAEAVARLQHPNIVQIHEVGEAADRPFIALEFVAGGSLAERLAGQPLPPRDAARLVAALAEAMHLAHSRNLVHRDLKPANVLLAGEADTPVGQRQPKVTDFGLVRQLDADSGQTFDGVVMGTPSYMAPEQAEGRARFAGPAADVYALGAILYECLTGRPPFEGATPLETLEQVRSREPAAPSSLNRQAPRDLETICLKCLRKEPERRYSSAQELADDLGRFVRSEPVAARPVGVAERVRKWAWRRPAAAGLLAAVVLLVAVGGTGTWLVSQQWAAARDRQAQTEREVHRVLEQTRGSLEEAWQTQDLAKLTEALAGGNRAVDIARSGEASTAVRQEAEAFRTDAVERLGRAKKNRALLDAVLDVSAPQETGSNTPDNAGLLRVLNLPSADEQYAAAFRRWGLDMDRTAEAEVVERLRAEPDVVVQELIAALDGWMMERRRGRPQAQWRRLFRIADQLDRSGRNRRLRALLVDGLPPRGEWVAGLAGVGSPWSALWEPARGVTWRHLLEVRKEIDPRKDPALTVVLLAQACAAVGDTAAAERVLRQAATAHPGQVVLLDALGKLLERQGPPRLGEAIGYYRTARGQRHHLGISLSRALLSAGRAAEAGEVMQELVLLQPDNAAFCFYLGNAAYFQKKYAEAEAAYRKAINLNPGLADAYNNLGGALNVQEKHREAEAVLRKVIHLKPNFAMAYTNLGSALKSLQKYGEAEAVLRKAIDLKPDYAEAHCNLGSVLLDQQRPAEAEAVLRKAIDLKPDLAIAYDNLGNALSAKGKHREAEAAHQKAIDLDPSYAGAYYNLGNGRMRQEKWGEAEAAYRKAIDLNPGLKEAHFGLGYITMQQARFDEAAAALKKAGDLFPATNPGRGLARQLRQQCQRYAALDARLPAILQGIEKPANAAEQIEFAQLCRLKKLYAAGAHFYAAAFAAEPKLAEDVVKGVRYDAVCAAALAGCAPGKDAEKPDGKERARLRRQALDWLRADLTWWAKTLENGTAQARTSARQRLQHSQSDPDLTGVRDRDGLACLPTEEREQWERLWSEVDALLRRVSGSE
jgi:eukaryotic-like serine/threonine-protein kinase